ncbi:uncharacterized protein LOC117322495 isoform X4 [Pecten maximus]|uniref:uncharacterized protein LOC117322495 isoform X3 n=1 Tax=Pecten maximus TaxID=6579 RepID=UPI001458D0AF|nr:uncharacterized protein LOC117322495 isoform X3 [Pecten maximus]XP_033733331.1 uncharacterized protein LOC117322495 isoform X4 [Pecten maximus]
MAPCYFLMVAVCMAISVRGSPHFTLSSEEISWSEARDACAENGSILTGSEENDAQIDELLSDANISNVWTGEYTFLTDWVAYQGCHRGDLSDIQGTTVTSPKVGRCQLYCQSNGSEYFILQDTDVCKCIDNITGSKLNRTHDSHCNRTCGEGPEKGTRCGGTNDHVVSLYRTSGFERHDGRLKIICENKHGTLSCPPRTVINITYANYGLTELFDSCPKNHVLPSNTNCIKTESTAIMQKSCNDKRTCTVTASNDYFKGDPCRGTTKLLNVSYTCLPTDCTEDLCRVFKLDTNNTVILMTTPCDSGITSTACITYNETSEADEMTLIMHNGTRDKAIDLCRHGYVPGMDNTTRAKLLEKAHTNQTIWSGYVRQRIDVSDGGIYSNNGSLMQCYSMENYTRVRRNCTEKRRYICRKESVDEIPTIETVTAPETESVDEIPTTETVTAPKTDSTTKLSTVVTTTRQQEKVTLRKPRKSSREDTKVIGVAAGIAVGCIVLVVVTAFVVNRLCKRSAKKKKHKKKQRPVMLNEIIRRSDPPEENNQSDSSTDESEHETNFTTAADNLPQGRGETSGLKTVKYSCDIANEKVTDDGHVNDAYAYAETASSGSAEGVYDAMELCIDASDDEDHIYSQTMLPLPDDQVTEDVSRQQDIGDAYDVMQPKVKGQGNGTTYGHTDMRSAGNGGYDVFNKNIKVDVEGTYDHAQIIQNKNAGSKISEYDVFNGKVKGDEYCDSDMYDHTKGISAGLGKPTDDANNVYDTCNAKGKCIESIDDVYDHAKFTRENQDENLYDLNSKGKTTPSVDEDPYDHV